MGGMGQIFDWAGVGHCLKSLVWVKKNIIYVLFLFLFLVSIHYMYLLPTFVSLYSLYLYHIRISVGLKLFTDLNSD